MEGKSGGCRRTGAENRVIGGAKRRNVPMTVAVCKLDVSIRKRIVAGI